MTNKNGGKQIDSFFDRFYSSGSQSINMIYKNYQWKQIVNYKLCKSLRTLSLKNCGIRDGDIELISSQQWPQLIRLCLEQNSITCEGIRVLLQNKWEKLKNLSLCTYDIDADQNPIGDSGFLEIIKKLHDKLQSIYMQKCMITETGVSTLLNYSDGLSKLCVISLGSNRIGSKGVKILTKINLPQLEQLYIHYCGISGEGMKHLCKGDWSKLNELWLYGNKMNVNIDESLQLFNWQMIKRLKVQLNDHHRIFYMSARSIGKKLNIREAQGYF